MTTNTVLDKPEQAELIVDNTILDANAFDYSSDEDDSFSIGDEEDNIVDEENNIVNNFFDIEMNSNPVFNAFSDMFSSAAAADEISMTDDNSEIPEEVFETIGTVNDPTSCYPFCDLQTMILFAFINGDNDMISQQMLKKILLAMNLIIKIQQETSIGRTFKLTCLDALLNYQARKKFKMPVFPSQRISVPGSNGNAFTHINLPSDHLRFLMAKPKKSKLILSMPDCTPNQSICLEQGEKWRIYHLFQQPMHTVNANKNIFAREYLVRAIWIVCYGVEVAVTNLRVEQISHVDTTPVERDHYYSISSSLIRLSPAHDFLLFGVHPMEKPMPLSVLPGNVDCDAVFYKVRIVSIILFTNDTSGNCSKQYILFESWLMRCAALPFKDRNLIANIQFLSTIPKKDGTNGMSLLPVIVDDFKKLKKGVKMFSTEDNAYVLVVAPIVWIEADMPYHLELCRLLGPATIFPCRRCYIKLRHAKDFVKDLFYFCESHERRTQEHYVLANSTPDRDTEIPNAPKIRRNTPANEISFRDCSTGRLLELWSFDPEKSKQDVCLKFAKQKSGTGIERFIKDNNESLFYYTFFGGLKELKNNNDSGDIEDDAIQNNSFDAFVFRDDPISRPCIELVSGSVVKFLSIVPRMDNDRNNNYVKTVMTGEHSDIANMNLVSAVTESHVETIDKSISDNKATGIGGVEDDASDSNVKESSLESTRHMQKIGYICANFFQDFTNDPELDELPHGFKSAIDKPTITCTAPSGRITRKHLGSSQPLEVIEEEITPSEEPLIDIPTSVNHSVLPHHAQQLNNNSLNSVLDVMASLHTAIREEIRLSTQNFMESYLDTTEERAEKKRRVDEEFEMWARHTAAYEKDVETRAREAARREREVEIKAVDRERKARRDEIFLLEQKRMNDILAGIVQQTDKDNNTWNNSVVNEY
ncbi:hypothetical protein J3Q64DRAFT_1840995 [Phycomyces blakesleeanus]|uniref:Uncharacterized protein n=1 Tax=Phycomyces blakesleeanus TaxID=4837 RepID=A0ABR3AL66_PHYBL